MKEQINFSKELDTYYDKYKKETNMTFSEMFTWSNQPISQKASIRISKDSAAASLDRKKLLTYANKLNLKNTRKYNTAQLRNLVLLGTRKKDYNPFLLSQLKKAVQYLKRAKKIKSKNYVPNTRMTYNDVALLNWSYNRFKKIK